MRKKPQKWNSHQSNAFAASNSCERHPVRCPSPFYLMPVFQFVVREVELKDVGAEGSDLVLVPGTGDATAVEHQHTGQVQAVWHREKQKMPLLSTALERQNPAPNMDATASKRNLAAMSEFTSISG